MATPHENRYHDISATGYARQHNGDMHNYYTLPQTPGSSYFSTLPLEERNQLLISAAKKGQTQRLKNLLNAGANLDIRDQDDPQQKTVLMHAASAGHKDCVAALLAHGADVYAVTKCLDCRLSDDHHIADCMPSPTWHQTALWMAARNAHVDIVSLLVPEGAPIFYDDRPLVIHLALYDLDPLTIRTLLKGGMDANRRLGQGMTFLMLVVMCDPETEQGEMADILVEAGTEVDAQDNNGLTALMYACHWDSPALLRKLLIHNASVHLRDNYGETALHGAARWCCPAHISLLISYGADVTAEDNYKMTPLDIVRHRTWWGASDAEENQASVMRILQDAMDAQGHSE